MASNDGRHSTLIEQLCRICGRSISRYDKTKYEVKDFSLLLDQTFRLVTSSSCDKDGIHPKRFCQKCKYLAENFDKKKIIPSIDSVVWSPHSADECSTCSNAEKAFKGGRPKKPSSSRRGRPKEIKTLDDVMSMDPHRPIPPSVEKAVAHVMNIKVNTSTLPNKSVQVVSSGPQPLTLTPVTIPRKDSLEVAPRTLRKRSREVNEIVKMLAGGTEDAYAVQAAGVIKSAPKDVRENIIKRLRTKTTIPAEHVIAMKASHNIPWNLLREIRSWLREFDVHLSSEGKARKLAKDWIGKGLQSEYAPLLRKKGNKSEVVPTPWCYIFNLVGHVLARLDNLQQCKALVQHPFIPLGEIHVKFGGDHGGGSFKSSYQIANVNHPNKLENTVIFSMFTEKDTRSNLRICLERYKAQIRKLQEVEWSNDEVGKKRIRVFMYGDYEYLCAMFGLTGANGRHPCIFCTITASDMQLPKGSDVECTPRDLELYDAMYSKFCDEFRMNLKNAKNCFNVIDKLFFNIPLQQVCLPGLHMTLGIFMKVFRSIIEKYCKAVDSAILEHQISKEGAPCYFSGYVGYVELIKKRNELTYQVEHLDMTAEDLRQQIEWLVVANEGFDDTAYQDELNSIEEEIHNIQNEISAIEREVKEEDVIGPCIRSLDKVLKEIGVVRQAYYGNTITGNHCHLLLKDVNIVKLCSMISDVVFKEVGEGDLYRESLIETRKMISLLQMYATCHNVFNSAQFLEEDTIAAFRDNVVVFMDFLRSNWPSINISPKLHLLEYHTADFLQLWGTGCGFYGEQGAESAHNGINRMKERYKSTKNDILQLKYIMDQHLLSTNPKALDIKPPKKTRKSCRIPLD